MRKSALKIALFASAALSFSLGAAVAETIAIKGGTVHTMGQKGVIEKGIILIEDGKIRDVGQDISIPSGAQVIDATGKVVTPGLMHGGSRLGLSEISMTKDSNGHSAQGSPFSAAFDVRYGLKSNSSVMADNRRHGLTHAITQPSGSDGIFAGSGALIALTGDAELYVAKGPMVAKLAKGGNRNVAWTKLRLIFDQVKFYTKNRSKIQRGEGPGDFLLSSFNMDALIPVVEGKQKMVLSVYSEDDLRQAISFQKETGVDLILSGATEAWKVADQLAAAKIPVLINPQSNLPENFGEVAASFSNAALLHKAGVDFAIIAGDVNHNAHTVNQMAGIAAAHGLDRDVALAAITSAPARIFGFEESLGSLEKGKTANVVIWDGDPLEVTTNSTHVLVDGVNHPLVSRRTLLRDRYLGLNKKPFAYH